MSREWSGKGWRIRVTDAEVVVAGPGGETTVTGAGASGLQVRRRWLRRSLLDPSGPVLHLRGLSRARAAELQQALTLVSLGPEIAAAVRWHHDAAGVLWRTRSEQRWLPREAVDSLLACRPAQGLLERVRATGAESSLTATEREALEFLEKDLGAVAAETNEAIVAAELASQRDFLDTIEKSPLTDEQARAVVCFDNRVQVLAAAGSGKTSVMVARAAYSVARGFVRPERILLLAFNKAAADELGERITVRFAAAGIDSTGVRASTFHSFGLEVIGRATGAKPRLASWLDRGDGLEMIERIVDELRDSSPEFRYRWDLYRLLFAHAPVDLEVDQPDAYDSVAKERGYRTFGGQVVRSHGERLVADFLYLNGLRYEYEKHYVHDVADSTHGQYQPDFYYPDIDVWHEHWALDRDGRPPESFVGYAEGIEWKRRIHAQFGTKLIETTWAEVVWGDGLAELGRRLESSGLVLDWNPDRTPVDQWAKPMKHEDLARQVGTFMSHVKSNSWTRQYIESRLESEMRHLSGQRSRLFLELYWQIHDQWQRRLADEGTVDFEDMLVQAASHLEAGAVDPGYDLVMVDEFQDASRARARLVRALVSRPGRYLLAVGDDWQSINRFAGADLSVMTGFADWFGKGTQLALTTTFRCPQTICDVARDFVARNPAQFKKPMRSAQTDPGPAVGVIRSASPTGALAGWMKELSASVADGTIQAGPSGRPSIFVLGRYGFDRDLMPPSLPGNLDVIFRTAHSSKGLEADYVVLPAMTTGTYGFPSTIMDDPVLQLAMPAPETYEYAEERRLFYVGLTRARRSVTLITEPGRESPFVVELLNHPKVVTVGGREEHVEICPRCGKGTLVLRRARQGRRRPFLGCSRFPACDYTRSTAQSTAGPK